MRLPTNLKTPLACAALALMTSTANAADVTISAGAGFDDTTPAAPVGGNSGTTVGEQRLIAFQFAASLWSAILDGDQPVIVNSSFAPQTCNENGGVLGGASPVSIEADFAGAPIPDTWYFSALANTLAGTDLNPGSSDINATFNASIDNNDGCLAGSNWYYGLDNSPTGSDIDFLNVVMHEIGHGLGSASVVNVTSGTLPEGRPDIFSRFAFDTDLQLHYDEMTNAQRAQSVTNTGKVVWDGPAVTQLASQILGASLVGEVTSPALGEIELQPASYGPQISGIGLSGNVVLIDDGTDTATDGCEALTPASAAAVAGNIALIDRGNCNFTVKTVNAQNAGAIGVIVANNNGDGLPPMGGNDASVTISSVGITLADGDAIKAELPGVEVSFFFDPNRLAGANADGLVRLFAPGGVQPGSTFSHFDTVASPNLLMEPSITGSLEARINVDLTAPQYQDIGWGLVDEDDDLIPDINDNCQLLANGDQRDTNGDGFGNVCDADINNDGIINFLDIALLGNLFLSTNADADFNGDGIVNFIDVSIMGNAFLTQPGPSGIAL
ncbi:MAG: PA domain-containing protein [Gammaproteobacteria bacterium]